MTERTWDPGEEGPLPELDESAYPAGAVPLPEPTLRGGAPLPEDYPLGLEDLHGDVEAVPPEKLDELAAYYGDEEPEGEAPPEDAEYI